MNLDWMWFLKIKIILETIGEFWLRTPYRDYKAVIVSIHNVMWKNVFILRRYMLKYMSLNTHA
jgi:hypothetical protein